MKMFQIKIFSVPEFMKPDSYHLSPALLDDLIFSSEDKTGSQIQPGLWESSI